MRSSRTAARIAASGAAMIVAPAAAMMLTGLELRVHRNVDPAERQRNEWSDDEVFGDDGAGVHAAESREASAPETADVGAVVEMLVLARAPQ